MAYWMRDYSSLYFVPSYFSIWRNKFFMDKDATNVHSRNQSIPITFSGITFYYIIDNELSLKKSFDYSWDFLLEWILHFRSG